jgi:hypothetical protein
MIRLLLAVAAIGFLIAGFVGMWTDVSFNNRFKDTPAVVSINDIVGHPLNNLPKALEVKDVDFSETVCIYDKSAKPINGNQQCDDLIIPLITAAQEAAAAAGTETTPSIIARASPDIVARFNADNTLSSAASLAGISSVKGVVDNEPFTGVSEFVPKLQTSHLVVGQNTVYLYMKEREVDTSENAQTSIFVGVVLAGVALFLPKIKAARDRRRKATEAAEI